MVKDVSKSLDTLFISKRSLEFPLETKYTWLECRAEQGPSSSSSGAALLVSLYLARGLGLTLQHTPPHQAGGHCRCSAGERGGGGEDEVETRPALTVTAAVTGVGPVVRPAASGGLAAPTATLRCVPPSGGSGSATPPLVFPSSPAQPPRPPTLHFTLQLLGCHSSCHLSLILSAGGCMICICRSYIVLKNKFLHYYIIFKH